MPEDKVSIAISTRWLVGFGIAGATVGFGAAFIVGPVVDWLIGMVGDAPGPLRLAATLPTMWAIPVLAIAGLCVGVQVGRQWQKECGVTTISAEGVTVQRGGTGHHVAREEIRGVFIDGDDLVLVDHQSAELLRTATDQTLAMRLQRALDKFSYPWQGTTNPHEQEFAVWVDGRGPLDARAQALLRARQRALADKRIGAAEDARDQLRDLGITVRDRDDAQQYRVVTHG